MRVIVIRNANNAHAIDASLMLLAYLNSQGASYELLDSSDLSFQNEESVAAVFAAKPCDLAVVLGGDGTILRTARFIGTSGIPLLGINFGHLGFLANSTDEGVVAIVAAALAGDVHTERRTNLRIDVFCEGDDADADAALAAEKSSRSYFALNELALTRGARGRIIEFDLLIAGSRIATMRGDGMVVATATGSTAYALSAGGPLISPDFEGLLTVPLAPHTLHSRAIVTAKNDIVEIDLSNDETRREATLFVDGELLEFEKPISKVLVCRGEAPTNLLRYKHSGFYDHASEVFFR